MKCDGCGNEVQGTHIYYRGKNRCWKCDEKFNKELKKGDEK